MEADAPIQAPPARSAAEGDGQGESDESAPKSKAQDGPGEKKAPEEEEGEAPRMDETHEVTEHPSKAVTAREGAQNEAPRDECGSEIEETSTCAGGAACAAQNDKEETIVVDGLVMACDSSHGGVQLDDLTVKELKEMAKTSNVTLSSAAKKKDIVAALAAAGVEPDGHPA